METLNKDLIGLSIHEKYNLPKSTSREIVDMVFNQIVEEVKKENEVYIYGFGKFKNKNREERTGFNPHTKEKITISSKKMPTFEPAKGFLDELNL